MRNFVFHLMVLWLLWWQLTGLLQTQDWGPLVHWPRASSSPMLEKREQAPLASVLVQATHSASSCNVLNASASSTLDSLCCLDTCFAEEVALLHTGNTQGGDLGGVRPGEVSLM